MKAIGMAAVLVVTFAGCAGSATAPDAPQTMIQELAAGAPAPTAPPPPAADAGQAALCIWECLYRGHTLLAVRGGGEVMAETRESSPRVFCDSICGAGGTDAGR